MNEKHFIKMARRSPFKFYEQVGHIHARAIEDENGNRITDANGNFIYSAPSTYHSFRATIAADCWIVPKNSYYCVPTENKEKEVVYVTFLRGEDTKIIQKIMFWTDISVYLVKEISQKQFKHICEKGFTITTKQIREFENEQRIINKKLMIEERMKKLMGDFENE